MLSIAICALTTLLVYSSHNSFSQKKALPACTQQTFAAFKPLPKMEYECPAGLIESDDRILKLPERRRRYAVSSKNWKRSQIRRGGRPKLMI